MIVQVRKKASANGSEMHSAVYVITREWDWIIRKSKRGKRERSIKTDSDDITTVKGKREQKTQQARLYSRH